MVSIKLVRVKVVIPDDRLKLHVVYEDQANPLKDSGGNVQLTSNIDESGNLIPEYPEFAIDVDIPDGSTPSEELIDSLLNTALEQAKIQAQTRANNIEAKDALKQYIDNASASSVDFEGTVDIIST